MAIPISILHYQGPDLPTAGQTFDIVDTTLEAPSVLYQGAGLARVGSLKWFSFIVWHSEKFTLNFYFKQILTDKTLSPWRKFHAVVLNQMGDIASQGEVYIEPLEHLRVEFENGNMDQTELNSALAVSDLRSPAFQSTVPPP